MKVTLIINYFVTLFMLCSPLTAIPVFLSLTQGREKKHRQKIGFWSGLAVAVILIITTWIGAPLLAFLGIRIPAFQCAGGIIVFLLALSMLNAQISPMRHSEEETKIKAPSVSVVPLAIPVMAGPGALSSVIVASNTYTSLADHIILSICGIGVGAMAAVLLCFAVPVERKLGSSGLNIVTRIGGLILAALAIEIFVQGLEGLKVL
ncbi:MAG: NAAT family transporter [Verrucomicrobia bacterium]|jgi:multiple antibiotic resistance protein|nr:NAAT family transporter [Verrucomicrobiota bacterium]